MRRAACVGLGSLWLLAAFGCVGCAAGNVAVAVSAGGPLVLQRYEGFH